MLWVKINDLNIYEISTKTIEECRRFFEKITLSDKEQEIAKTILKEIIARLTFLIDVGLDYVSISRNSATLSSGESQRIRLATQIGSGLTGVLYVLDEPSIGLHQRDNERLLGTLKRLRDLDNTVIVVEHDHDAIVESDYVVDLGPGAGENGGYLVFQGTPEALQKHPDSLTGLYLSKRREIKIPEKRKESKGLPYHQRGQRP